MLNVTPDSFSDGGQYLDPNTAYERGVEMFEQGAAIVDVGGESTRPGAEPVPVDEELRRVIPVIERLADHGRVSVDTRKEKVAREAVAAGATLINDVSASLWNVAAECSVGWVAMHMRGEPRTMQDHPTYREVVCEVRDFLVERAEAARRAGVEEVWIDPGIGFGKLPHHNLMLLKHVGVLVESGFPVLVGTSRKSFIGLLHSESDRSGEPPPPTDRLEGSIATAVWALLKGARMVRVHDVEATVQAVRVIAGRVPGDVDQEEGAL